MTPGAPASSRPRADGGWPGDRRMRRTGPERHGGLADVLDDHLAAEFASRDPDATMATMTGDPYPDWPGPA